MQDDSHTATQDTRRWLERAVIGLNLCPFAKAVHVKGQVHYAVTLTSEPGEVLEQLAAELDALLAADAVVRETTLLIVPCCLENFLEFNDIVARGERLIRKRGHEGIIQLASFHPDFQFAGSEADDIGNFTNRAPYPTLHLLREASVARAVDAVGQPEQIYEDNVKTLEALGMAGWVALEVGRST